MSFDRPKDRDALMEEKLEKLAAAENLNRLLRRRKKLRDIQIHEKDGKLYLKIYGLDYRVLTREVTDFSQPIVQIGAEGIGKKNAQELVVLDPSSKQLKEIYDQVKQEIIDQLNGRNPEPRLVLRYAMVAVRGILSTLPLASDNERRDIIDDITARYGEAKLDQTSIIPIQHFIREHIGACRHHGLFIAYVLDRLVHDKEPLLPPGTVFYQRENLDADRGAHAWAVYKPIQAQSDANGKYDFYLVDSMWGEEPLNVMHTRRQKLTVYGETIRENLVKRYNRSDLESVAYSTLDETQQEEFIERLLNEKNPDICIKFLNYQYKLNPNNLNDIEGALLSHEYKYHKNGPAILQEIYRVLNTDRLHKQKYTRIGKDEQGSAQDNRQQFVFGLLCKTRVARDLILDGQSEADLFHLKRGLEGNTVFEEFDSYSATLGYIKILLNIASLHRKHYAELVDNSDKEQFVRGLLKNTEQQNLVLARQNDKDLRQIRSVLNSELYKGQDGVSATLENINKQFSPLNWIKRHRKDILIFTGGVILAAAIAVATVFTLGAAGVVAGGVLGGFAAIGKGLVGVSLGAMAAATLSTSTAVGVGVATALVGGPALMVAAPAALLIVSTVVAAIMSPFEAIMRFAYNKGKAARKDEVKPSQKTSLATDSSLSEQASLDRTRRSSTSTASIASTMNLSLERGSVDEAKVAGTKNLPSVDVEGDSVPHSPKKHRSARGPGRSPRDSQ